MRKTALGSILFAGAVLAVAVTVEAQQQKKIPRIGYLALANHCTSRPAWTHFVRDCASLGTRRGKTLSLSLEVLMEN